jgi:PAS domain S-box-containing protein
MSDLLAGSCNRNDATSDVQPPDAGYARIPAVGHAALFFAILMVALVLPVAGGEAASAADIGRAPVLSGCEPDYPPYCVLTPDNQADGFSVELLRAALKAVGREVVFRTAPWAEIKQELADGRLEVLPLVGRTPEREAVYDFTSPYLTVHGAIVVREGTVDIRGPADLKGRHVAVLQGDNAEEYLRRANLGAVIVPLPSFDTALRELSAGRHDAVVIQRLVALHLMQIAGLDDLMPVGAPLKDFTQSFCFAVRKGDTGLLAALNEGLAIVMADGTFRMLHAKWFSALEAVARKKSRIVVGGDSDFPPYEFLDRNGQPTGYNVDLTRAIARQMGLAVDIRLETWSRVRQGLESGETDVVQGMFYSVERDRDFDFSPQHEIVQHAIVVRTGTPVPADMMALAGKTILVMAGDMMEDLALQHGYGKQLAPVLSQQEALRLLAAGEQDCALVAKVPALYWIAQNRWHNLEVSSQPVLSAEYCYATPRGKEALLAEFSEGLAAIKATGEYRRIRAKWLSPYEAPGISTRKALKYAAVVVLPLLALLFGSLLWSRSLKRQVVSRTRELMSERAFLDRIINAIADPVFVKDDTRRFVLVNDAFCGMIGHPREGLLGGDDDHLLPQEQVTVFRQADAAVLATGRENVNEEFLSNASTGAVHTVVTRKSCHSAPDGKRFIVGVIRDMTERKRAEDALRDSEERYRALVEHSADGILIAEMETRMFQYANPAMCRMLGYAEDEVKTLGMSDIVPRDDLPRVAAEFEAQARGEKTLATDITLIRKDGTLFHVDINSTTVTIDGGLSMLGIFRDITERKRMEGALREQQNLASMGTLARGMAHEINNPIMGVMNYAELIRDRAAGNAPLVEFADEILAEGRRVARMTQSLLGFTEQKADPVFAPATLADLMADVLPPAAAAARAKGIALSCGIPADLPPVSCRRSQIEQVVTALLTNAMEAWAGGPRDGGERKIALNAEVGRRNAEGRWERGIQKAEGGTANAEGREEEVPSTPPSSEFQVPSSEFRVRSSGSRRLRLTVEDNGPGIPEAIRERVFDPFFTTKDRTRHSGLGLWISRSIVQEHGGELSLESEDGKGTRVHVDLPVEVDAEHGTRNTEAESKRGST